MLLCILCYMFYTSINIVSVFACDKSVELVFNFKQISIKRQDIPLDGKFSMVFNGESCQSVSVGYRSENRLSS